MAAGTEAECCTIYQDSLGQTEAPSGHCPVLSTGGPIAEWSTVGFICEIHAGKAEVADWCNQLSRGKSSILGPTTGSPTPRLPGAFDCTQGFGAASGRPRSARPRVAYGLLALPTSSRTSYPEGHVRQGSRMFGPFPQSGDQPPRPLWPCLPITIGNGGGSGSHLGWRSSRVGNCPP